MNKIEANHIGEINLVSLLLRQLAGKFCDAGQFWYVYPILAWQQWFLWQRSHQLNLKP